MLKAKQSASKNQFYSNINDVTRSLNAIHLTNTNEWINNDMEIDNRAPSKAEFVDEVDIMMSINGEREMYEIYMKHRIENAAKSMEVYLSITSDVVVGI